MELLTTSSIIDECFYEQFTVLFDLMHEDVHANRLFTAGQEEDVWQVSMDANYVNFCFFFPETFTPHLIQS